MVDFKDPKRKPPERVAGFSLVEMLATVAALVILLGLMVSLARYVRRQASDQLTQQLLVQLDMAMRRYQARYQTLPSAPAFVPAAGAHTAAAAPLTLPASPRLAVNPEDALPDEATLQKSAEANNLAVVQALRIEARRYPADFTGLPQSFFAAGTLPDAWGTPVVFMPALHPAVGMAMENRPFFLSAGADRRFRTQADNLYSYEEAEESLESRIQPAESGSP